MNPAYQIAAANSGVKALLGTSPLRFYPFGEAEPTVTKPYAVWQTVYGSPWNLLNAVPREDRWGVQVDCYADTGASASAAAKALRDAFESDGYVIAYNTESREPDTRLFRVSFTVELNTLR